jgi:hypothetical protein
MKKQQVKKGRKSRRGEEPTKSLEGGEEPTKRKKKMHPEIKESLKLSEKGSYYKQEDFYSSTDESNEDTNSNSELVLTTTQDEYKRQMFLKRDNLTQLL